MAIAIQKLDRTITISADNINAMTAGVATCEVLVRVEIPRELADELLVECVEAGKVEEMSTNCRDEHGAVLRWDAMMLGAN